MLIQLFSSISVNMAFRIFTSMLPMSVNILPLFTSIIAFSPNLSINKSFFCLDCFIALKFYAAAGEGQTK